MPPRLVITVLPLPAWKARAAASALAGKLKALQQAVNRGLSVLEDLENWA